jgi:hypothetical protein
MVMTPDKALDERIIQLEFRIAKVEAHNQNITEDLRDIKRTLRWLTGIAFSLNSTIIGILTKGFGILQ